MGFVLWSGSALRRLTGSLFRIHWIEGFESFLRDDRPQAYLYFNRSHYTVKDIFCLFKIKDYKMVQAIPDSRDRFA